MQERLSAADVWPATVILANTGTTTVPGKPPGVHIAFIPAGCTGKAQLMDVGVQKPIKDVVRKGFHAFLLERVHRQLAEGKAPEDCRQDMRISALNDPCCTFLAAAFMQLQQKPDLIKSAP